MKEIIRGDMLSVLGSVDHFIICTGSNLRSADKTLVMLNGLAGVLAAKYPVMPAAMGKWILDTVGDCGIFNLRCVAKVGLFQNMILPRHGCDLGLVSRACILLSELARANPEKSYALEHPGGTEPEFMVQGLINMLPANVSVWKPE